MLRLDHIALQHPAPEAVSAWLCLHFGMRVHRVSASASRARFLQCPTTGVMLEIYRQPEVAVPDYAAMPPATLHVAFYADDLESETMRLLAAGAQKAGGHGKNSAGDEFMMLRDPWGVSIQLVRRV